MCPLWVITELPWQNEINDFYASPKTHTHTFKPTKANTHVSTTFIVWVIQIVEFAKWAQAIPFHIISKAFDWGNLNR